MEDGWHAHRLPQQWGNTSSMPHQSSRGHCILHWSSHIIIAVIIVISVFFNLLDMCLKYSPWALCSQFYTSLGRLHVPHHRTVFCQTFSRIGLVNGCRGTWLQFNYTATTSVWQAAHPYISGIISNNLSHRLWNQNTIFPDSSVVSVKRLFGSYQSGRDGSLDDRVWNTHH